jgi:lysophospholipase L1-like esterase
MMNLLGVLVKRIGWIVLASATIVASLLTFPAALPWMICVWLALHTLAVHRGRSEWIPLMICCAVVVAKRPDWSLSLSTLVLSMAAVALVRAIVNATQSRRKSILSWSGVATLWIVWAWFAFDYAEAARMARPARHEAGPIVCLGDSLTAFGYPRALAAKLSVPVIDLGISGCTTTRALELIGRMQAAKPHVVIVELGGHDFLQGHSRAATAANLRKIIEAGQSIDADVILVEIPRGFMTDPFRGLERELARKYDLELIPDTLIRKLVIWSPYSPPGMWCNATTHLSDDGLHPNDRGIAHLAEGVAATLIRMYGADITKQDTKQ